MIAGYVILYFHCKACQRIQPFYHIKRRQSPNALRPMFVGRKDGRTFIIPTREVNPIPDNARLVRGQCMICGRTAEYVIAQEYWDDGRSRSDCDYLCICGLPADHRPPHLQERRREANISV